MTFPSLSLFHVSLGPYSLSEKKDMRNGHYNPLLLSQNFYGMIQKATELLFFFFNFYCVLKYSQLTNNVVIVSGEPRRDSVIHIHVSILPQAPLPPRLPQNTEQNSLCCTAGPCWVSILNTAVCTCPTPNNCRTS